MNHDNRVTDSNKAPALTTLDRILEPDTRTKKEQNVG